MDGVQIALSPLGEITRQCWKTIPDHYRGVQLDLFVVMPDHLHGLLQLTPVSQERGIRLGRVIGSFHAAVTRHARQMGLQQVWQHNYYDHIVRDHEDMIRIREYIAKNPIRLAERNQP